MHITVQWNAFLLPGEPMSTPVNIAATDMLAQMLLMLQADPAEYTHTQQNDGTFITRCTFCKDMSYLPDIKIQEIYSPPKTTIESSKEAAALTSLQHVDTSYQIHFEDYNYKVKEQLIDQNKTLLHAKHLLTSALIDIYNTLYRDALIKLESTVQSAYNIITTTSELPVSTEEFTNIVNSIIQSLDAIIYDHLLNIYNNMKQILEHYGGIKAITSKICSYIV